MHRASLLRQATLLCLMTALLVSLSACSTDRKHVDQLQRKQQQWQAQDIRHYRYTLRMRCLCASGLAQPVTFEVRDGQRVNLNSKAEVVMLAQHNITLYDTIDELFLLIEESLSSDAASVSVVYNKEFGYPEQIEIDSDHRADDDEVTYMVERFEILP